MISHFGGTPYAEEGDAWPICPVTGYPLDFVFQINLAHCPHTPIDDASLYVFFYGRQWAPSGEVDPEFAAQTDAVLDEDLHYAWVMRRYEHPSADRMVELERPSCDDPDETYVTKECGVIFTADISMPSLGDLGCMDPVLASQLENMPGDHYGEYYYAYVHEIMSMLRGSRVGGYPMRYQDGAFRKTKQGKEYVLLFGIESEEGANEYWLDLEGLMNIYVNPDDYSDLYIEIEMT